VGGGGGGGGGFWFGSVGGGSRKATRGEDEALAWLKAEKPIEEKESGS